MFPHFSPFSNHISSDSQQSNEYQFNNAPISHFVEQQFQQFPDKVTNTFITNHNTLTDKLNTNITNLKEMNQQLIFTYNKYEPKLKEMDSFALKFNVLISKMSTLLSQLISNLQTQMNILSSSSNKDIELTYQIENIANSMDSSFEICYSLIKDIDCIIDNDLYKNATNIYKESNEIKIYLNEQCSIIKDNIENIRSLNKDGSWKMKKDMLTNTIKQLQQIKNILIFNSENENNNNKENKENSNIILNENFEDKNNNIFNNNIQHSIKKNKGNNMLPKYFNAVEKRKRMKQLTDLFY
jgi:hypothetical protein